MKHKDFEFEKVIGSKYGDYWFRVVGETKKELTEKYMEQSMIEVTGVVFSLQDGQFGVKRLFPFNYDVIDNPEDTELYNILKDLVFSMIHK